MEESIGNGRAASGTWTCQRRCKNPHRAVCKIPTPSDRCNPDSGNQRRAGICSGEDVEEINALKRQGLSIQAISHLTGFDRKTIRSIC